MLVRVIFLVFICFLPIRLLHGAADKNLGAFDSPSIREARVLHDGAVYASRKEVENSERRIFLLLEKEPNNELLRAYAGSLLTIKSGKSFPGPEALRIFKEGVQMMNEAVENAPNDINVRLIRAINHYELPAFFNRRKQAREDFCWLLSMIDSSEGKQLCDATRAVVYYYAGLSLSQTGEKEAAHRAWREGLEKIKSAEWRMKIASALGNKTAAK
jgi:tetratricopeptide (TPR) repeat protein